MLFGYFILQTFPLCYILFYPFINSAFELLLKQHLENVSFTVLFSLTFIFELVILFKMLMQTLLLSLIFKSGSVCMCVCTCATVCIRLLGHHVDPRD